MTQLQPQTGRASQGCYLSRYKAQTLRGLTQLIQTKAKYSQTVLMTAQPLGLPQEFRTGCRKSGWLRLLSPLV
jgi:hypothetical protein